MASEGDARRLCQLLFSLVVLSSLLCAPAAFAEPSSADKETARTLLREGDEKFAIRDYAGALKAYQAAHAIMQVPTTGLPLAKAQIERGLLVEARDTLLQISRHPKEPNESQAFTAAREEAAPLAQKLAERIPSITITVEGPPRGSSIDVLVDDVAVPQVALGAPRKLNPGQHVIKASASGFQEGVKNVSIREGENQRLTLKLTPGASSRPQAKVSGAGGRIHVVSPNGTANVFVDGKAAGVTPLEVPIEVGTHTVEVEYPGGTRDGRQVDVTSGQPVELSFEPSKLDAAARYRRGVHLGIAGFPSMAALLEGGPPIFGGGVGFVLNFGIIPLIELRSGVSAAYLYRPTDKWQRYQLSIVAPVMLELNYNPWLSMSAGLSVGFATEFDGDLNGLSVGPEWSVLTMRAGDKRQFELGVLQGVRLGDIRNDFHQSVVFTYLFLN